MTLTINGSNFKQEVLESKEPVLVDFWASWCGPCRMVGPLVDELAEEYSGRVKVGKVNVDDEQSLAQQFGVMSIPTLIVFKEGQVAQKVIGARSKADLAAMLDNAL